jgi:hypothetical protein
MNRDELAALRDAIDTVLTWPDAVRDQVARWLTPAAAKPNGRDPHPPPIVHGIFCDRRSSPASGRDAGANVPPGARKAKKNGKGGGANVPPGAVADLREDSRATAFSRDAGAFGRERECAGEGRGRESIEHRRAPARARLARGGHEGQRRSLAACGGTCGRDRGPYAAAVELTEGPEPELLDPRPADAHAPWLKPLDSYDRRERCEFQVSRYG